MLNIVNNDSKTYVVFNETNNSDTGTATTAFLRPSGFGFNNWIVLWPILWLRRAECGTLQGCWGAM